MHQSRPIVDAPLSLKVDIGRQILEVRRGGTSEKIYTISTSRFGIGTEPGSFKTPLGRFEVMEKHGDTAPLGMVFKSRKPTGMISPQGGEEDLVLTRILWLAGMQPENANTFSRYIYIHGTNHEARLGEPSSHGCVRMSNEDIVDLYEKVPVGTPVEITL